MNIVEIAYNIKNFQENIILIYAFNSTGKTRLSVAFKDITRDSKTETNTGVYYNAFSEDLFVWDNDTENNEENIRLTIKQSRLNQFHGSLTEEAILDKLRYYRTKYDFYFNMHDDIEKGINSISFFIKNDDENAPIKISRGEERIFVWCLFLAMFEVDEWTNQQSKYLFIDDPVSSLDDHNIFITTTTIYDLIENQSKDRKIIITTHHIGLFSILANWLTKGEKSSRYKEITKILILNRKADVLSLENPKNNVFLYHLHLLQMLDEANKKKLFTYHFALLRQVLENIASFLGSGRFGYVLDKIGIQDQDQVSRIINSLSHQNIYRYQTEEMNPDNEELFKSVFEKLKEKYQFKLYTE